jgi:hypothetical protein
LPLRAVSEPDKPTEGEVGNVIQRFLQIDTSSFTPKQLESYHHAHKQLRKGRRADEPRTLGLTGGLIELAEDFNGPLPNEDLFYNED